jgi:hypothetical protein
MSGLPPDEEAKAVEADLTRLALLKPLDYAR